jgi:hypothetical protein
MLADITLEVDLAAVCRRKFSSFSMAFDDSIDSLVPYHMLYLVYMNALHEFANSQRAKLQQMSIL